MQDLLVLVPGSDLHEFLSTPCRRQVLGPLDSEPNSRREKRITFGAICEVALNSQMNKKATRFSRIISTIFSLSLSLVDTLSSVTSNVREIKNINENSYKISSQNREGTRHRPVFYRCHRCCTRRHRHHRTRQRSPLADEGQTRLPFVRTKSGSFER